MSFCPLMSDDESHVQRGVSLGDWPNPMPSFLVDAKF